MYKNAILEIIEFDSEDVISTSGGATIPNQPIYSDEPTDTPDSFVAED